MKGKIFNKEEVQAILNGSKVMFREVIKPQPNDQQKHIHKTTFSQNKKEIGNVFLSNHNFADFLSRKIGEEKIECPYQVGQKIFVKEAFALRNKEGKFFQFSPFIAYETDGELSRWAMRKPAQYMKQEHSRLTLLIKEIRVERLASISDEDALKEGVSYEGGCEIPRITFKMDWNATHKKPEEKFEANPFVWVVDFKINK